MFDFDPGDNGRRGRWRDAIQCAAIVLLCVITVTGCRRQAIWAGAAFFAQDQGQLRLAASQPLCGCLTLVNDTTRSVLLRTTVHGSVVGGETLQAGQRLRFRFDWAGPQNDDYYLLEGLENGRHLDLRNVTRLVETPRWQPCSTTDCAYGRLGMNVAETGR